MFLVTFYIKIKSHSGFGVKPQLVCHCATNKKASFFMLQDYSMILREALAVDQNTPPATAPRVLGEVQRS
jgi:hypothetical protein